MPLLQPNEELPPELSLVVQLALDDNRPTLILDSTSSKPRILFRNSAFEHVVAPSAPDALDGWILAELEHPCPAEATQTTMFAERGWMKKKLGIGTSGTTYIVLYCSHDFVPLSNNQGLREPHKLDSLVYDWIQFPDKMPTNDWIRYLQHYDWSTTAIAALYGPQMRLWPAPLRQIILTFMQCPHPRVIYWGHDLIQFYNEAAATLFGAGHPASLGNKQADVWGPGMWDQVAELIRGGWEEGRSLNNEEKMLLLDRDGFLEEAYFDWYLLPFCAADGNWICSVNCFNEVTASVLRKNRDDFSHTLLSSTARATTLSELWLEFLGIVDEDSDDVSFALLYTICGEESSSENQPYRLHGSAGLTSNSTFLTPSEELIKIFESAQLGEEVTILKGDCLLPELAISIPGYGSVNSAFVFPVSNLKGTPLAFVVLGMNPRRRVDSEMERLVYTIGEMLLKTVVILQSPFDQRKLLQADDSLSYRVKLEKLSRQLAIATLKVEKNQESFSRMAENAPIGMFLNRADGSPLYTNDQYHLLLGKSREDFWEEAKTSLPWRNCIHPDDEEFIVNAWRAVQEAHSVTAVEFRVKAATKTSPTRARWLECVVFPQRDADGNLETLQGYLTDISARKFSEALSNERMNDAIESKRASENFIDMISHEIRNPLSSILQLADVVLANLPDTLPLDVHETLADAAQTIIVCAMHQKTIIDEVLTFSKLDNNLLVLCSERARPGEIVRTALKMFEAELAQANVETRIEQIPDDCAVGEVLCDPGRLLQVIINLLTNSIKFTKASETRRITVSHGSLLGVPLEKDCDVTMVKARKKEHEDITMFSAANPDNATDDIYLYFSVEDTGLGMTLEESQLLFQRFAQASPKTYRQYGGSGLGLFICRELVELQQGQIGMRSEAGIGSKFAFYIKAKRVGRVSRSASVASVESAVSVKNLLDRDSGAFGSVKVIKKMDMVEPPKTSVKDMHVLIVEDNEINRKVMSQQLRKLGCQVHVAEHGLEALNFLSTTTYLSSTKGGTPLSLILLDVEMPIMDGLTCIRRIRQLEESGEVARHIPVIAITANARSEQIATAIEAGMDEVVTKPFKIRDLVPRMESLVDKWSEVG